MRPRYLVFFVLASILLAPSYSSSIRVEAQINPTLADSLNTWLDTISYGNDVLSTHYGVIFGKLSTSSYDILAQRLVDNKNWQQIVFLKRVCELSDYDSMILNSSLLQALTNMPMVGALPQTWSYSGIALFLVYDGYMMHAYRYAEMFNLTAKWDKQKAFQQLAGLVDKYGGGFLACTADKAVGANLILDQVIQSTQTRYYDEQAECLRLFDILDKSGVNGAKGYADKLWSHLNNDGWWDARGWYWYRPSWQIWECEMGGFAMITSQYLGYVDQHVLSDINWKLLHDGWNSGCWLNNVIVHGYDPATHSYRPAEMRPLETNAVWRALQSMYPCMSSDMKGNMTSMLVGSPRIEPAWMLSMNSGCFNGSVTSRLNGIMTMFLTGIVPVSGNLALGYVEESCAENVETYRSDSLQFDYSNHRIRIPVRRGELKFLFGTEQTVCNFTENGVYDVYFTDDWNSIIHITQVSAGPVHNIADINNDGSVNNLDAILLSMAFSSGVGSPNWDFRADLNADQKVDILDALILADNYGIVS